MNSSITFDFMVLVHWLFSRIFMLIGPVLFEILAEIKAERVHLCRVAGNTVWSHMASEIPYLTNGRDSH